MSEKTSDLLAKLVEAVAIVRAVVEADHLLPEEFKRVLRHRLERIRHDAQQSGREASEIEAAVEAVEVF